MQEKPIGIKMMLTTSFGNVLVSYVENRGWKSINKTIQQSDAKTP
jgi:hypothetical protein